MFSDPFEPVSQPGFELIDRFSRGGALDLGTDEPPLHIEVRLRDDGSFHRRIVMPAQFDAGVQHRPVSESAELADLGSGVFGRAGQLPVRRHVDVEDRWKVGSLPHDLLLRRRPVRARGSKVTAPWTMAIAWPCASKHTLYGASAQPNASGVRTRRRDQRSRR